MGCYCKTYIQPLYHYIEFIVSGGRAMNTIEEILKSKSIYEVYADKICPECNNTNKEDCDIRKTIDGTVKCYGYKRCMTTKCKECSKQKECLVTAKQTNPVMRGLV